MNENITLYRLRIVPHSCSDSFPFLLREILSFLLSSLDFSLMTQLDSTSPTSQAPQYVLSAVLRGHTDDVRSLASTSTSSSKLFSASRDGTARSWNKGDNGWEEDGRWEKGHEGFVNAVCYLNRQDEEGKESDQGESRSRYYSLVTRS